MKLINCLATEWYTIKTYYYLYIVCITQNDRAHAMISTLKTWIKCACITVWILYRYTPKGFFPLSLQIRFKSTQSFSHEYLSRVCAQLKTVFLRWLELFRLAYDSIKVNYVIFSIHLTTKKKILLHDILLTFSSRFGWHSREYMKNVVVKINEIQLKHFR